MIPNDDQPLRRETISRMLKSIAFRDNDKMTKWEEDFIDSMTEQFEGKDDLSNKQCKILERIYDDDGN